MEDEEKDEQESLNPAEESSDLNTEETADLEEETTEESVEELKAKLKKQEELAGNYKIRAEKAEKKAKETKPEESQKQPKGERLSDTDIIALAKADIHKDDISEVLEYARFKDISVSEALNAGVIKTTLAEKKEQRKVAEATNTKATGRSSKKKSDEQMLAEFEDGKIEIEDPEEAARLQGLRVRQNMNKNKQ